MRHRFWLPWVTIGIAATVSACAADSPPVPWELRFEGDELRQRARRVEARIVEGSCNDGELGGAVRYRKVLRPGRTVEAPPALSAGTYCFAGRASDASCHSYARGHREVTIPWQGGSRLSIEMGPVIERTRCTPSQCKDGSCKNLVRCGNGSIDGAEQCDDGNTDGSDACRNDCTPGCESGRRLPPVAVFDPTPGIGEVCGVANAMRANDMVVGLDRPAGGAITRLVDDEIVSACIAFDFGARLPLDSFVVRATFAHEACGMACDESRCSGDHFEIYVPQDGGESLLATVPEERIEYSFFDIYTDTNETLTDHPVSLPDDVSSARYAIICRGGGGKERGDVGVDSVLAVCR